MDHFIREAFLKHLELYRPLTKELRARDGTLRMGRVTIDRSYTPLNDDGNPEPNQLQYDPNRHTLAATLLPVPATVASLGGEGFKRVSGIFQVDVYYPETKGPQNARNLLRRDSAYKEADRLMGHFRRGAITVSPTFVFHRNELLKHDDAKVPDRITDHGFRAKVSRTTALPNDPYTFTDFAREFPDQVDGDFLEIGPDDVLVREVLDETDPTMVVGHITLPDITIQITEPWASQQLVDNKFYYVPVSIPYFAYVYPAPVIPVTVLVGEPASVA